MDDDLTEYYTDTTGSPRVLFGHEARVVSLNVCSIRLTAALCIDVQATNVPITEPYRLVYPLRGKRGAAELTALSLLWRYAITDCLNIAPGELEVCVRESFIVWLL